MYRIISFFLMILVITASCSAESSVDATPEASGPDKIYTERPENGNCVMMTSSYQEPPQKLSDTGCFETDETGRLSVKQRNVMFYMVNMPLYTGADKDRYIVLPDGTSITGMRNDSGGAPITPSVYEFPVGTFFIKEFFFNEVRVETRFLVHHTDGLWRGYSWQWQDDQKEAILTTKSESFEVNGETYIIPSRGQCVNCHNDEAGNVLAFSARQLQQTLTDGETVIDQLQMFEDIKVIDFDYQWESPLPDIYDESVSDDEWTGAYLEANCSYCHRPAAYAGHITMDLRQSVDWNDKMVINTAPQAGDLGISGGVRIKPGSTSESLLYYRVNSMDSLNMMPPYGRVSVDEKLLPRLQMFIDNL